MAIFDRERYLDRRTYQRHIKSGTVTEEQYEQYLSNLPDMTEAIMPKDEGGDDDGFETREEDDEPAEGEGEGSVEAAPAAPLESPPMAMPPMAAPMAAAPVAAAPVAAAPVAAAPSVDASPAPAQAPAAPAPAAVGSDTPDSGGFGGPPAS